MVWCHQANLNEVVLNQTFSLVVEENARNNRNTVQMSILDPGLPDATNLRSDKEHSLDLRSQRPIKELRQSVGRAYKWAIRDT